LQIIEKHFKAGVLWYQEQQLKPAAKPLIKKESKTWFSVNCWSLKRK
jgi:sulfate adenylyltransferase subunit 1 (EFTu-like GTPase family)